MKKYAIFGLFGLLTACQTTPSTPGATQPTVTQTGFVQACSAYETAFTAALQLRIAGKLTPAQITQITTLDGQVTPVCSGPLPSTPQVQATIVQKATDALLSINSQQGAK